jgi:hypothetical protein
MKFPRKSMKNPFDAICLPQEKKISYHPTIK